MDKANIVDGSHPSFSKATKMTITFDFQKIPFIFPPTLRKLTIRGTFDNLDHITFPESLTLLDLNCQGTINNRLRTWVKLRGFMCNITHIPEKLVSAIEKHRHILRIGYYSEGEAFMRRPIHPFPFFD
jgi:hypothetical protein